MVLKLLAIWIVTPVILIAVYELLNTVNREVTPSSLPTFSRDNHGFVKDIASPIAIGSLGGFLIFLGGYVFLIFHKEEFAYYDDYVLTHFSLAGKPYPMPVWKELGRFWPLGLQEYNLLALLGRNQFVYRSFNIFQLVIVLLSINRLLSKLPSWYRVLTMVLVMVTPSITIVFFGLIYPERNVIFWLAVWACLFQMWQESKSANARFYLYGALVAAQLCLYYKEPVCILIGSFAVLRLLSKLLVNKANLKQTALITFLRENFAEIALLILSIIFVSIYVREILPFVTSRYQWNSGESSLTTLTQYLRNDFLLVAFLGTLVARGIYLLVARKWPNSFWDPLAVAGVLYFLAFVKLNMYQNYYMAPVGFIAVLYLSQLVYQGVVAREGRRWKFLWLGIVVAIAILIMHQSIQKSAFAILQRKTLIAGHVQMAQALEQYAERSGEEVVSLFFPLPIANYSLAIFGAFLEYKGINLFYEQPNDGGTLGARELSGEPTAVLTRFMLKAPIEFKDNRCVDFSSFQCFHAASAESGDLVALLPGVSEPQKVAELEAQLRTLFAYEQSDNLSIPEKLLVELARPPANFLPFMNVYLFQKP